MNEYNLKMRSTMSTEKHSKNTLLEFVLGWGWYLTKLTRLQAKPRKNKKERI